MEPRLTFLQALTHRIAKTFCLMLAKADIINGAWPGGPPHIRVLDGVNQGTLHSFLAYDAGFRGGLFVAGNRGR